MVPLLGPGSTDRQTPSQTPSIAGQQATKQADTGAKQVEQGTKKNEMKKYCVWANLMFAHY